MNAAKLATLTILLIATSCRDGSCRPPPEEPVPACEPGDKECPVKPPPEPTPLPKVPGKADPVDEPVKVN